MHYPINFNSRRPASVLSQGSVNHASMLTEFAGRIELFIVVRLGPHIVAGS